jgi:hypothetical protein
MKSVEFKKLRQSYIGSNLASSLFENKNSFENQGNEDLANLIHSDIKEICLDSSYAFFILKKIFPHEKAIREILNFELLNYKPKEKVNTLDEIINIAISALTRFQYKVGGFNIEDADWIVNDNSSKRFKIEKNQKILYNSIENRSCDKELLLFLDNVISYVRRHIENENNFDIKYTFKKDDRFVLSWIVIIVTDKTITEQ